jgi:hypothetical protein
MGGGVHARSHYEREDCHRPVNPQRTSRLFGLGIMWVRGLHHGSASAMKLRSTRLAPLRLEAAGPGPQQAEGESPDEEGVYSTRHDRFPELESVPSFGFHHTTEGEDKRPEWSVRRWVPASFLPCH